MHCYTCRRLGRNNGLIKANVAKERPKDVCMACMKAGKHMGCEKKKLGDIKIAKK